MLKITGIELFQTLRRIYLLKKGIRDLSYIDKRNSKANNKYMKCYDSSKERKFILYLDENDLYGLSRS